ncbi:MAG: leucyl/phenylalanyl-tRNA--protein transferase [Candidatus Binatia bacterium]
MPIYQLNDEIIFPRPDHAEPDGLLAVGGDLGSKRLLLAYQMGIFPWYAEGQPILWWSPDPRLIFELSGFHISRRLGRTIRNGQFKVTFDEAFGLVIQGCAEAPRKREQGTWITSEMQKAYINLHRLGFAHSTETWFDGKLVGGIYGVSLGRCFFGESMFSRKSDASKVALAALIRQLREWGFHMIDAQVTSQHLISLGAREISRPIFLKRLKTALTFPTRKGSWNPLITD